jgi:aromatic-L-amino-acid decarboxylase
MTDNQDRSGSADLHHRQAPVNLNADEFRKAGYQLVDHIAEFLESLPDRPVTPGESPAVVRAVIGDRGLPAAGMPVDALIDEVTGWLFDHSLHNGHPRFWGYITSPAAPLGVLADMLAAAVNPNQGRWDISPIATEIEAQTIRWLAELINFPTSCGGLMVSGGNMANFLAFMAARKAKASWDIRAEGLHGDHQRLTCYGSTDTHTWIEKAADVAGLGTDSIRWIATDSQQRIDMRALEKQITRDIADGCLPFIIVGTAGTTGTGAIDPLPDIAALCREHDIWFHADGAYGAPAAALEETPADLKGLSLADSVALDPHKWLYSPLEAACVLVRDPAALPGTFGFKPSYYQVDTSFEEPVTDYYTLGMQNSRGFRALKVWMSLRHIGRDGYLQMFRDDIALARNLYQLADEHPELEACTQNLSITTFRYVGSGGTASHLNKLNERLVTNLQKGGEVFVSNAIVDGTYLLRACVVNFRTTMTDIEVLPEIAVRIGRLVDAELKAEEIE